MSRCDVNTLLFAMVESMRPSMLHLQIHNFNAIEVNGSLVHTFVVIRICSDRETYAHLFTDKIYLFGRNTMLHHCGQTTAVNVSENGIL